MIYLAVVIGLIASGWIGYRLKQIELELAKLRKKFTKKTQEQIEQQEVAKSTLIDPDDPVQAAHFEHLETLRQLNPQTEFDDDEV
jgi:hypothetical protein